MWDIGGCRCILNSTKEVYRLRNLITANFEVRKERDYIENPKEDGYKSLHIFIKSTNNKVIEVQLRNQKHHNWATLVEISDILFDAGIKEYGRNKDLSKFHKLLAKNRLQTNDKIEIAKILKKYKYYDKLNEVFTRNSPQVREQWLNIELKGNQKYFLLITNKEDVPKIKAFSDIKEAENTYFELYKKNNNSNVVLTHLPKTSFKQISSAYSNYTLTYHTFLNDWLSLYEDLISDSLNSNSYLRFNSNFESYTNISIIQLEGFTNEMKIAKFLVKEKDKNNRRLKKLYRYWQKDLEKLVALRGEQYKLFSFNLIEAAYNTKLNARMLSFMVKRIRNKYQKRLDIIDSFLKENSVPINIKMDTMHNTRSGRS
jgi:hypothetical protein